MEPQIKRTPVLSVEIAFAILRQLGLRLALSKNLGAQTWNSHLEGLITDPSGAVIPQANVALTNTASGQVRRTVTNSQGFYTFPSHAGGAIRFDRRRLRDLPVAR